MIFSKANLHVASVASRDEFDRGLHGVQFEPDGSTVAGNGRMMMAVGPADSERAAFPPAACDQMQPGDHGTLMPLATVDKAIRQMPKEKRAALQYVAMSRVRDPARVGLTSVDSKGDPTTIASLPRTERFPAWREAFRRLMGRQRVRVCLNRKDLQDLLRAMEAAAPNMGDANPVFLEVSSDGGGVIARCVNHLTRQRCIGAIGAYKTDGTWLEPDSWERQVYGQLRQPPRKKPVKK